MKALKFIFSFSFLVLVFVSCNNAESNEKNANGKAVVDAPAYNPSSQRAGDQLEVKGECIVFYHPAKAELDTIINGAEDYEKFKKVVDQLKPKLEADGYAVYVSSDNSVQMNVSDTRSHFFDRTKMVSDFGAVFYSSKNGPYFCEGLRDEESYLRYVNRYFKGTE